LKKNYLKDGFKDIDSILEIKINNEHKEWTKYLSDNSLTDRERFEMVRLKAS
jgi:hypothetical protein